MSGVGDGSPVHHATCDFLLTVSVNPTRRQLREVLHRVLTNPNPRYRHVIYSGPALSGSCSWQLRDGAFTCEDLVALLVSTKDHQPAPVYISAFEGGPWSQTRLARAVPGLQVVLNPEHKSPSPSESFVESLSRHIDVVDGPALLGTTDTVGSISFARPTLYVFPAGDGGSSLFFGVHDLSVVCDAGTVRCPAFWNFVRHFSHVDVLIGTHAGSDNIFGLQTFVERQCRSELMLPKLGHVIFNGSPTGSTTKPIDSPSLLVRLPEEVAKMTDALHDMGVPPQVCASPAGGKTAQKVNLYQKVGRGSVDLFVTQPVEDCRELKEFRRQCASHAPDFVSPSAVPLTSMVSVVAAMVWKPYATNEKPVRILLPGSAPLAKLYEGLDRLQGIPLFESVSGSPAEQVSPMPQSAKLGSAKPGAKLSGTREKQPPQSATAGKSQMSARARDQTTGSVSRSPKGTAREASGQKTALKTESPGKTVRVAKASSTQPSLSDHETVKCAETTTAIEVETSQETGEEHDTKLLAVKETSADHGEAVGYVQAVEPGTRDEEEIGARDSAERDSLEASTCDEPVLADSLCGEDKDHSDFHNEDEFDPNKPIKVEKISDNDDGKTDLRDTDMNVEEVNIDNRDLPGLEDQGSVPSDGNGGRVDESLSTIVVAEMNEEAGVPLDSDNVCRPVNTADVDADAAKETEVDEEVDADQCELEQEMGEESDRQGVNEELEVSSGCESGEESSDLPQSQTVHSTAPVPEEPGEQHMVELDERVLQDLPLSDRCEVDDESDGLQHSPTVQSTTHSVPKEPVDKMDDVNVPDIEPDEVEPEDKGPDHKAAEEDVECEFDGEHSNDLLTISQQSEVIQTTSSEHVDVQQLMEDTQAASTDASQELKMEVDRDQEDSGVIPEELSSPEKEEAECLEAEQEDPVVASVTHDESSGSSQSPKGVGQSDVFDNPVCEEEDVEKIPQDRDLPVAASQVTVPDSFDELEGHESQLGGGASPNESRSTSEKLTEDDVMQSDFQAELEQHPDVITISSDVRQDEKTEFGDGPVHHDLQPDFSDELSPDSDKIALVETNPEELSNATEEETAVLSCEQTQQGDHIAEEPVSPSLTATDGGEKRSESPKLPIDDTPEPLPVCDSEQSTSSFAAPADELQHSPRAIDTVDDVPVSPVEQTAPEDFSQESERPPIYYTEPQIELADHRDHGSDVELPVSAATGTDDHVDSTVQPRLESSSPAAPEEPSFPEELTDPIQSWGSPMGLPAPLGGDNKDGGKKRDSGARGTSSSTAKDRVSQAGKTGVTSGRMAAKPGKPTDRSAVLRKSTGAASDVRKVGKYFLDRSGSYFVIK